MTESVAYQQQSAGTTSRDQVHTLFARTMGYVAATTAFFALGAWLGRDLTGAVGIIAFIAAFACLFGMRFAARTSMQLHVALPGAFALLIERQLQELDHFLWLSASAHNYSQGPENRDGLFAL